MQEAVYHCLPELWFRKVFPAVIYGNINIPEKRFRVLRSQKEIGDLPDDRNESHMKAFVMDVMVYRISFDMQNF